MVEPRVVVAHREDVWWLLSEAAQLEHMIMCQYLFAEFSLKQGTDEGITTQEAEVVDRWRATLRSIAVQEMLHLALVANLSTSIGAAPTLGRPNFPQRSGYFPSPIQLALQPFGEPALQHFLYLERPEGMERQDASGFVPSAPPREPLAAEETMPRGQEYATIGHLYRGIGDGLQTLVGRLGEQAVFVGSPRAQATPELCHWPELIAVTDLASASAAVAEIIEQGEGARGDWRQAHYGRFLALFEEYQELRARNPSFEPTRPVLAAYTRKPFDNPAPVPIIAEPRTRDVAELAALAYELVLQTLTRFFTHTDETDQQLSTLVRVGVGLMAGVLRPLATELTRLPVGAPHAGCTAGFAFEMFYTLGNFVPWREPAWALLPAQRPLYHCRRRSQRVRRSSPGPAPRHRARGTPGRPHARRPATRLTPPANSFVSQRAAATEKCPPETGRTAMTTLANTREETIDSTKGIRIFVRSWLPESAPRAVVVICHGLNAHSGQYRWAAEQLCASGLAVYALDLRGRGKSEGERFIVEDVQDWASDVAATVRLAKSRHAGLPVFLLGHSAGGVTSATYVLDNQSELAGFICEDFAFQVPAPGFALTAITWLSHIAPHLPALKLKNEDFSRDPNVVEALNNDPLTANEAQPVITVAALVRADERLHDGFPSIMLPLLILHGTGDKITLYRGSEFFHQTAGSTDKTLKLYEGHYHDLLADYGKEEVMADIKAWIDARIR